LEGQEKTGQGDAVREKEGAWTAKHRRITPLRSGGDRLKYEEWIMIISRVGGGRGKT